MESGRLGPDGLLDELEFLATVEHALVVEYLTVCCALGHDLEASEGGATTNQGRDAAGAASILAIGEMFRLKGVNSALVDAGRSAQLGRAASISSASVAETAFDPLDRATLERLVEREHAIAMAVDARYRDLVPAVTSDPVFDGHLLDALHAVVADEGPTHAAALEPLRDALDGAAVAALLRATRRDPADAFEQRLLNISDRTYRMIVVALRGRFGQQDVFAAGEFRGLAVSAMETLDEINRVLAQRGLLPPFTAD